MDGFASARTHRAGGTIIIITIIITIIIIIITIIMHVPGR
jgi:hypothetical protein